MGPRDLLRRGYDALACGDWVLAEKLFEEAVRDDPVPDALDGLGLARWWRKDVRSALDLRTRAHRGYKADGRGAQAARVAIWLAREHRALFGNEAVADGWLARARTLAAGTDSSLAGWLDLARAEAEREPEAARTMTRAALESGRTHRDPDLEISALARLGLLEVADGSVEEGTALLDEAMAGASSGEATDLQTVGSAYCALMEAGELLGDSERFAQWTSELAALGSGQGFGPFESVGAAATPGSTAVFCGACCGGMYLVTGRLDRAEAELLGAISELERDGMSSRCIHPVTQLAELRVLQGRYEEARSLLEPFSDLPEAVRPLASLELALGAADEAAAVLRAQLASRSRQTVVTLPWLMLLVDAELARSDLDAARDAARRLAEVAALTRSRRHRGEALFAAGKVATASADPAATSLLREAARTLGEASSPLQACRARLALARVLAPTDRPVAVTEASAALAAFERLGATPDADAAAAFLRDLGVRGRTGPRGRETLSRREVEVIRLVAQGLSNAEIADRLFISQKTAGHHVSNILAKLGLRSRTEAAAYAAVHLLPERDTE